MAGLSVLVTGGAPLEYLEEIRAAAPGATVSATTERAPDLSGVDVVAGQVPAASLQSADRLKWVHSWAAGPDTQLFPEFVEHSALLTCCKGNGAIPLAEHAMMLMLMLNRNALRWLKGQQDKRWDRFEHGELNGMTVGIIGTGNSGQDLALKCKAFHMRVLGMRRSKTPLPNFDRFYERSELKQMLGECDFVVVTAPFTEETRDILGEAEFRAMKTSAFYICFSRGGIANDAALNRALTEGWIAGAGLDAHSNEPLVADSPVWSLPNTIVTPHNGATTAQTNRRGREYFLENLRRYTSGRELFNVVDKNAGY